MKVLPLAFIVCLATAGCYTMIYPPPEELVYEYDVDSTLINLPDSMSDADIIIYNQNQIIFDQYYMDPYYYRYGRYDRYGFWDPYYYNPYGYNRDNRWHHGRYYRYYSPGKAAPKQKKPRRTENPREKPTDSDDGNSTNKQVKSYIKPARKITTLETPDDASPSPISDDKKEPVAEKPDDKEKTAPVQTQVNDKTKNDRNERTIRESKPDDSKQKDKPKQGRVSKRLG